MSQQNFGVPVPPDSETPRLVVCIGYGDELPVYERALALWELYRRNFPHIDIYFVCSDHALERGLVHVDGHHLRVGVGPRSQNFEALYAQTGSWSAGENSTVISRHIALYRFFLGRYTEPFFLYLPTVTSVVDFNALLGVLPRLPRTRCLAGPVARLNAPQELFGLTFVSGASTLMSSDLLRMQVERYDPEHVFTQFPDDVWRALILQDVPRFPMPTFNFERTKSQVPEIRNVSATTQKLLDDGHYHFRVKTTLSQNDNLQREDIDPWLIAGVMNAILLRASTSGALQGLMTRYAKFVNAVEMNVPAIVTEPLYSGPRDFFMKDEEFSLGGQAVGQFTGSAS